MLKNFLIYPSILNNFTLQFSIIRNLLNTTNLNNPIQSKRHVTSVFHFDFKFHYYLMDIIFSRETLPPPIQYFFLILYFLISLASYPFYLLSRLFLRPPSLPPSVHPLQGILTLFQVTTYFPWWRLYFGFFPVHFL